MLPRIITNPRNLRIIPKCTSVAPFSIGQSNNDDRSSNESKGLAALFGRGAKANKPLPPYPIIEGIKRLGDGQSYLPKHFKKVNRGDHEFIECADGFVNIYVKGFWTDRDPYHIQAGYSVCYGGLHHPLNVNGPIDKKEVKYISSRSTAMYALVQAFKTMPMNLFEKVCICTDEMHLVSVMSELMPKWEANNFRTLTEPSRRLQNLNLIMFLNEYVRVNQFTYRFKFTPNDCFIPAVTNAEKLARQGAEMHSTKKSE